MSLECVRNVGESRGTRQGPQLAAVRPVNTENENAKWESKMKKDKSRHTVKRGKKAHKRKGE